MARKKPRLAGEFAMFDVLYEDGSRSSHRKVPSEELTGLDDDTVIRATIEAQDQKVATMAGKAPREIKSITPSG